MTDTDFSKYASVSFRPGENLQRLLTERTDDTMNTVAKRDLQRYYDLLAGALPAFTEEEALLLCVALNGIRCSPGTLWANIFVALDEFEGNHTALLARIRACNAIECQAIIDAVERYWIGPYRKNESESRAALYRVGLVAK